MKNKKITRKITQGMYVLTTINGGCIVDAVSQVSASDYPYIAIAVMKKNYTNELIKQHKKFALSVLECDVDAKIIQTFGYHSMREIDKFASVSTKEMEGLPIIEDSLGFMICEVIDSIDNETHTLFIGKMIEADVFKDMEPLTYAEYQEHKEKYIEVKTEKGKTAWICTVCGYIYYGDSLPDNFKCPICQVGRELFKLYKDEC